MNGVKNPMYLSSASTHTGQRQLTLTFRTGTNLDVAQVEARIVSVAPVMLTQPITFGRRSADPRQIATTVLAEDGFAPRRVTVLQDERQLVLGVLIDDDPLQPSANTPAKVVIRFARSNAVDATRIRSQCQWLRAISADTDLSVPVPLANLHGDDVTVLGDRAAGLQSTCMITRWVKGRRRFRPTGPGVGAMQSVGRLMASLHRHGAQFQRPAGFACLRWDADGLFGEESPWYPEKRRRIDRNLRQWLNRLFGRARDVMAELNTTAGTSGLIHGDLTQANYVFSRGRAGAIDFGDFGHGYFVYDMAVTLLMLRPFDADGRQAAAFLNGYRGVRPIAIEQERLINTMIAARAALLIRWITGMEQPAQDDLTWAAQTAKWLRMKRMQT